MQQNIFLVGLMGAGKTTVGRLLAKRLGLRFVDSDHEIEARTGATISWIFEIEGEESFRRREVETIRDLTARSGVVLATGGGAVIHPENRKHLKDRGTVIYLRASVNNILQRTMHDKSRPLLQTENRKEKLEELASVHEAKTLQRQVFVGNRIKTMNESIYYNVDKIHQAISQNRLIRFRYYEWTPQKEMHLRRNGKAYEISRWGLTWDDENYYMVGYDDEAEMIKHFRVDKMLDIEITDQSRSGKEHFEKFDLAN